MDAVTKYNPNNYYLRRNRQSRKSTASDKLKSACGAIVGTAVPVALMMKKRGIKNPFKLNYGLQDMIILSGAPIIGAVGVGMIGNDKQTNRAKLNEGVFQFLNASVPTWITGATLCLCETSKKFNNIPAKVFSMVAGVLIGMHGAAALSNIICDPKDKYPDRKLTLKDSIANIDDLIGVLVLSKFPLVGKLHIEKALPAIYAYCGYRAGKSN